MSFESDIYGALAGHSGLSTLVGARVYPDVAPQAVAKPYVVWQQIWSETAEDFDGPASASSLDIHQIQITSWADTAQKAISVQEQVRLAIETASAFDAWGEQQRSMGYESDTKLFGRQIDFFIGRAT